MSWTPREVDLRGQVILLAGQIKAADEAGDEIAAKELRREEWLSRHELRRIVNGRDNDNVA
jgi:hypothetical protein